MASPLVLPSPRRFSRRWGALLWVYAFAGWPSASSASSASTASSPSVSPEALASLVPECSGNVYDAFLRAPLVAPHKSSNRYVIPERDVVLEVEASVMAVLSGDLESAWDHAFAAGFVLCRDPIADDAIYVWQPALQYTGWASFAVRPGGRPLIVEVPHPVYDTHTLDQGVGIFDALSARAVIVAGAHRCANRQHSACDGITGVCGRGPERYRESDMAHTVDSVFHAVHRVLAVEFDSDWVLSLHGMSERGISISDGTTLMTRAHSPVVRFAEVLTHMFPKIPVRSCNPFEGRRDDGAHVCGTTNVQGRQLNGLETEACVGTATVSSDRFLHLEQSISVRRYWRAVAQALDRILPRQNPGPRVSRLDDE
ncbi:MAG: hypothetical protein IPK13_16210 [Deltaproteobacteria bacterium]|nr:hypothetical protein [Deltaproteobacteria bacterium]